MASNQFPQIASGWQTLWAKEGNKLPGCRISRDSWRLKDRKKKRPASALSKRFFCKISLDLWWHVILQTSLVLFFSNSLGFKPKNVSFFDQAGLDRFYKDLRGRAQIQRMTNAQGLEGTGYPSPRSDSEDWDSPSDALALNAFGVKKKWAFLENSSLIGYFLKIVFEEDVLGFLRPFSFFKS